MKDPQTLARDSLSSSMLITTPLPTAPHLLTSVGHGLIPNPTSMPSTTRPKLSLQTSALHTNYGTPLASSSRRTGVNAATTPTTLNTFVNTFELSIRSSPVSASGSPTANHLSNKSRPLSPFCRDRPYELNLPYGVKPILKNSSLSTDHLQPSLISSASPRTHRKVFFPSPKKVSFRPVLEEEIMTRTYTAQHADLSSSEDEGAFKGKESGYECNNDANKEAVLPEGHEFTGGSSAEVSGEVTKLSVEVQQRRSRISSRRGITEDNDFVASKRCKRSKRRWEWTLTSPEQKEARVGDKSSIDIPAKDGAKRSCADGKDLTSDHINGQGRVATQAETEDSAVPESKAVNSFVSGTLFDESESLPSPAALQLLNELSTQLRSSPDRPGPKIEK